MEIWSIIYERPEKAFSGFGRAVWSLSVAIQKQKFKTRIVYFMDEPSKEIKCETIDGVTLYGIPSNGNPFKRRLIFYNQALKLIGRLSNATEARVFLLHGAFSLPLARSLKGLHTTVIYYTFGTLFNELKTTLPELIHTLDFKKLSVYAIDLPIETVFFSCPDAIVVPHEEAAEEFKRIYKIPIGRVHISPYGQDIFEKHDNRDFWQSVALFKAQFKGKKLILFIGGTAWNRKGAEWVLHSFNKLSQSLPIALIMTGKPTRQCLLLASKLGLQIGDDFLLPGLVDDRTLALFYAVCDVFFLPSLHEGFSQPVLEVMAFGKPVVASRLAAYPIVQNGIEGFVIHPRNKDSYASALRKILTDEYLYSQMSRNAKLKAEKYSWNYISLNMLEYIRQIAFS